MVFQSEDIMQVATLAARVDEQVGRENRRTDAHMLHLFYQIEWSCAEHGE